jgi:diguanylate cyclase (GGDEF) domain
MVDKFVSYNLRNRIIFWFLGFAFIILILGISNFWLRAGGVTLVVFGVCFLTEHLITDRRRLLGAITLDELTGLGNFRAFQTKLRKEANKFSRKKSPFTLILIDLDKFKKYNDTFGHRRGNELLRMCGHIFLESVRREDEVYRFGGDEFAVLLPDTNLDNAQKVAVRIRQAFHNLDIRECVTLSMGIATYQGESIEEYFDKVDNLLYTVKFEGGDCYLNDSSLGHFGKMVSIINPV